MAKQRIRSNRTYGVELEVFGANPDQVAATLCQRGIDTRVERNASGDLGYNHVTREYWKLVSDSTIAGPQPFELVSPILRGVEGLEQIKTVCQVLNSLGVQVNKSCGLHVHHGASDLRLNDWKNLVKSFLKYETCFDQLVAPSRRRNNSRWAHSVLCRFNSLDEAWPQIDSARDLEDLAYKAIGGDRYHKLNLMAFWRHGTVEFRQHGGTIDAEKIIHWVILTNALIEDACSVQYILKRGANSLKSLLDVLLVPAATNRFFQYRAEDLAA
jgi:Putative amidoligase enzyme